MSARGFNFAVPEAAFLFGVPVLYAIGKGMRRLARRPLKPQPETPQQAPQPSMFPSLDQRRDG